MSRIEILGCGGYHPTEERHTACFFLPEDGIALDAGTSFFRVRDYLATEHLDIVLSHAHLDHTCGLTFLLDVLWNKPVHRVTVHGRASDLEAVTHHLYGTAMFPLDFEHELQSIDGPFELAGWNIRTRKQVHPGGSLGFRFDRGSTSFAYMTDTIADPSDAAQVELARGVDVLLHECYFPDFMADLAKRSGHSTAGAVAGLAKAAGVGRLVLIHANPLATADELQAMYDYVKSIFPETILASDKMTIEL